MSASTASVVLAPDAVMALRSRVARHQQTHSPGATTAVHVLTDAEVITLKGGDAEGHAQASVRGLIVDAVGRPGLGGLRQLPSVGDWVFT